MDIFEMSIMFYIFVQSYFIVCIMEKNNEKQIDDAVASIFMNPDFSESGPGIDEESTRTKFTEKEKEKLNEKDKVEPINHQEEKEDGKSKEFHFRCSEDFYRRLRICASLEGLSIGRFIIRTMNKRFDECLEKYNLKL